MKLVITFFVAAILSGCDFSGSLSTGKYALFETSKGVVYRLNTTSGETEVIFSPEGWPKLKSKVLYEGENNKTYEYLGGGQLKELSTTEVADRLVEKYEK